MSLDRAKRAMRSEVRTRILALTAEERARQQASLDAAMMDLPGLAEARTVLLYAPAFPEEISVEVILEIARGKGPRLVFPRVDRPARRLVLCEWAATGVLPKSSPGKIPEPDASAREVAPEEIDWALIPGLAFDARGFRLGRGGGYYDRLLPLLRPAAQTWALILDPQWVDRVPVADHDWPIRGILSPGRQITVRRG